MKWFKHEARAHRDIKLKKLMYKYGGSGYGLYWYCIEQVCMDLEPKLTFELDHDSEILANELKMDTLKVEEIMRYMVDLGLFEASDNVITCLKLAAHLGEAGTRNPHLKAVIKEAKKVDMSQTVSDSLRQSEIVSDRREEIRGDKIRGDSKTLMSSPEDDEPIQVPPSDPIPVAKIVDLFHEHCPGLPRTMKLTPKRRGQIQQRWREDIDSLEGWATFFDFLTESAFLMGMVPGRNGGPPFIASLEWVTNASNFAKIVEGKYHGQGGSDRSENTGRLSAVERVRLARRRAEEAERQRATDESSVVGVMDTAH